MNSRKIVDALVANAAYAFQLNLTTGMVEEHIIGSMGTSFPGNAGLRCPFPFSQLVLAFKKQDEAARLANGLPLDSFSIDQLLDDYLSGITRRELNVFCSVANAYYRVLFFMHEDDETGNVMAFGICRQITKVEDEVFVATGQVKSKEAIERETFYKNMLDFQACGVLAYSLPGYKIISANDEALKTLGFDSIEDLEQNFHKAATSISYLSEEDASKLKDLRTQDTSVDYDCIINKGAENERYVIAKSKIVYSPNGRRIAHTTYVDATEMHTLRVRLQKAEEASRAKAEFLANISHDLRTPMNAIIGYAEVLQAFLDKDEKAKDYLSKLTDSSKFLMYLLSNAIELSSFEQGSQAVTEVVSNVSRFFVIVDSALGNAMENAGLTFHRSLNITHTFVLSDPGKVRTVVLNVLSNAIKFTPRGGTVTASLEELPSERPGYSVFKVVIKDTGIGISPEFLPRVFDEFAREESTTASGKPGAGLGLSVTKKLLDLMDGSISVESEPGQGTTVTLMLPLKVLSSQDVQEYAARGSKEAMSLLKGSHVLLAEDNDLNAEIAGIVLSDAGITWDRAKNGKAAVCAVQSKPADTFDLILMDIQMPVMDGYQAARAIRALEGARGTIPIIALSANALDEDRRLTREAGMNAHVAKPLDSSKLMEAMVASKLAV